MSKQLKGKRKVVWLKFHFSARKKKHLLPIASGVASSYTGDAAFHLIDLDEGSIMTVGPDIRKVRRLSILDTRHKLSVRKVIDFINSTKSLCFLMSRENIIPENLTSIKEWTIICIYVTLCRSKFAEIQTEDNIRKCLIRLRAVVGSDPEIVDQYWG